MSITGIYDGIGSLVSSGLINVTNNVRIIEDAVNICASANAHNTHQCVGVAYYVVHVGVPCGLILAFIWVLTNIS